MPSPTPTTSQGSNGAPGVAGTRSRAAEQRRKQIAALIDGLQVLPTSMTVPMHVLRLQRENGGSAGLAEYAAAVSKDPGLAAKILAVVNSAAFAPVKPITRLSQAVPMIGLKNLLPLVFSLSLGGIFNRLAMQSDDRAASFKASLLRGLTAQQMAARVTGASELSEEAFLCGLLLDIGLPVLCGSDRVAWPEALAVLELQDATARQEREELIYGTDHAAVGRAVMERLGLPALFADAVALHHAGAGALSGAMDGRLARAIDIAGSIPHRLTTAQQALQGVAGRLRTLPQPLTADETAKTLHEVLATYSNTLKLLGDEGESGAPFKQFLQDIAAVVAGSVVGAVEDAQSTITGLRARESGLTQQVDVLKQQVMASDLDGLTRVFTRAAFMKRIPALLAGLRQHGAACAVGYVDVDNFKTLNDTHGHGVGDAALRRVAERLTEIVQPRGLVGRVGGDEFVFLVVSRRPLTAEEVAQRFGAELTNLQFAQGDKAIHFTTSVGLFDAGVPDAGLTAEHLFAAADRLMYGGKKAGKGRCLFARVADAGLPGAATATTTTTPQAGAA